MNKYNVGDRVVLRKDLVDSEWYGVNTWTDLMRRLLDLPYVSIIDSKHDGFSIEESDYNITPEMVQCLYKEEKEMNIKAGDKVRVIEDVSVCNTIKKGDIVEIDCVKNDIFYVKDHKLNDTETQFFLFESEFELVEEHTEQNKCVWYFDSEDGTYFINDLLGVDKWSSHETQEIKKGKHVCYLLTEEEAKQSPFFDKFTKHDPFEKLFYICMKGNEVDYLNLNINNGGYFMGDYEEYDSYKCIFTEEDCNEIIGTSSILYKELVE